MHPETRASLEVLSSIAEVPGATTDDPYLVLDPTSGVGVEVLAMCGVGGPAKVSKHWTPPSDSPFFSMKVQALREQCVKHKKHIVNKHSVKGFNAKNTSQLQDLFVGLSPLV